MSSSGESTCPSTPSRVQKVPTLREARHERLKAKEEGLFKTNEDFQEYLKHQTIKRRITMEHSRYITGNYEQKREAIGRTMKTLVDNIWLEMPKPQVRVEFANIVNLTVSFSEMWHWIGTTMNREYNTSMKSFLPCSLIDKFQEFIDTITRCQRQHNTDMGTFSQILRLRDEVVLCLQDYYRVIAPIYEDRPASFPRHSEQHRYHPYDFEWLTGSIISGIARLSCVRYLCVSRMAHMDISTLRTDIIAMKYGIGMEFIKNVRVPLPAEATDSRLLNDALNNAEDRMREDYEHGYELLKEELNDNEELSFMNNFERFLKVTSLIRIKKRKTTEMLTGCERERLIPIYQLISVMVTLETQLLMVHRVSALFLDQKHGLYGVVFPEKILSIVEKVYEYATEETCREHPLCDRICDWLRELREETRNYCREFYTLHEHRCESLMTDDIDFKAPMGDEDYEATFDIATKHFPKEVGDLAPIMMKHLTLQQIEIRRLLSQFHQVRLGAYEWTNEEEEMSITLGPKGIVAFCSNVPTYFGSEVIKNIEIEAEDVWSKASNITSVGYEVIEITRKLMDEKKAVPDFNILKEKFISKFQETIGNKKIANKTATELAQEFAAIIERDIKLMRYRKKFISTDDEAAKIAEEIVPAVVEKYMHHINDIYKAWSADPTEVESSNEDAPEEVAPVESSDSEPTSSKAEMIAKIKAECRPVVEGEMDEETFATSTAHAAHLALMVDALDLTPSEAAIFEAASKAIFVEDPSLVLWQYDEVPDDLIDSFLDNIASINIPPELDFSASYFNLPVD